MISVKPGWHRPAKHHMSHRKVHQYQKKYHRGNQSLKQNRRLVICQCIRIILCTIHLISFSCICALFTCSISCLLHSLNNGIRHCRSIYCHGIRQKTHITGGYSRHPGYCLFHSRLTCCTTHARYVILFHFRSPFLSHIKVGGF